MNTTQQRFAAPAAGGRLPRRLVVSVLVALLSAAGCQSPQPTGGAAVDTALGRLHQAALAETQTPPAVPDSVAMPPGVDPDSLRLTDRSEARMGLQEVLSKLRVEPDSEPREIPEAESGARRMAMYHYSRGRQAALDGKHLVAITEFQKAFEADPASTAVLRELARSYAAMNSITQSLGLFAEVLRREPGDSEALLTIAMASADRRDFVRSVGTLALAWEQGADGPDFTHDPAAERVAWYVLAYSLQQLGYDRAAIEAGLEAVQLSMPYAGGTIYRPRLDVIYRQRGAMWRSIGDAFCRLGEHELALQAYTSAAALPAPDPGALNPRVIYANLSLGRRYAAQVELLEALRVERDRISDREIALCRYQAEHAAPVDDLAKAVDALYEQDRDRADLVRAAAALLPRDEAQQLLHEFLDRAPEDVAVASQLLAWLGEEDLASAVALTADLVAAHPDLAVPYVRHLAAGPPTVTALIEAARELPAGPEQIDMEVRLLLVADASGHAWDRIRSGLVEYPRDPRLLELQIVVAAALGEEKLVESALREASGLDTEAVFLAEARAWLGLNQAERSARAAEWAIRRFEPSYASLLALARAQAAFAMASRNEAELAVRGPTVVSTAERAIAMDDTRDDAYAVLFGLYSPVSPLANAEALRSLARRLLDRNPESRLYARLAARESITQARLHQALDRLLNLYESDPTDRESLTLAVRAWAQMDRLEDARTWLDKQMAIRPGDPAVLEQWTGVSAQLGHVDEAVAHLESVWEDDPENMAISAMLEQILTEADRVDESIRLGEARLRRRPPGVRRALGLAAAYARGEHTSAAVEQLRYILDSGGTPALDYAMSALAIAGTLDPDDPARQQVTYDLAVATIDRYPEIAPLQVYGSAMLALARLGGMDERFDVLARRAVEQAPGADEATLTSAMQWRHLAQMMVDNDHAEAAARIVRARIHAVARLDPESHSLLTMTALVADAAAGGRAVDSIALLRDLESRGRLPQVEAGQLSLVDALFEVSTIYSIAGDEEGADLILREVIAENRRHAMAMNNLGYLRLESGVAGADPEVEAWITTARDLEPEDANVIDTLGWLRYKQGRFEDTAVVEGLPTPGAITLIRDAIDRSEEPSGEVFDHLGDALYRVGEIEPARESWERAITVLEDPAHQQQTLRVFLLIQRGWGLLIADPRSLYDRDEGAVLERARAKVAAVDAGTDPAIAPTFSELN